MAPLTYAGFRSWHLDDIPKMWEVWQRKRIPVSYAADGTVTLRASFAKGARKWWISAGAPGVGHQLDHVKDLVLDWPADPERPHPRLFASQTEIENAWARAADDPDLMKILSAGGHWATTAVPLLV